VVSITSFNEWGEGTQIEPAVPRSVDVDALAPEGLALPRAVRSALRLPDAYADYRCGSNAGGDVGGEDDGREDDGREDDGRNLYMRLTRDFAAQLAAVHDGAPLVSHTVGDLERVDVAAEAVVAANGEAAV
jgi:hypothetical protein